MWPFLKLTGASPICSFARGGGGRQKKSHPPTPLLPESQLLFGEPGLFLLLFQRHRRPLTISWVQFETRPNDSLAFGIPPSQNLASEASAHGALSQTFADLRGEGGEGRLSSLAPEYSLTRTLSLEMKTLTSP